MAVAIGASEAGTPQQAPPEFVSIAPGGLIKIHEDNDEYQATEMTSAYIDRMIKVDAVVTSTSADPAGIVVITSVGPEADPKALASLRLLFPKSAEGKLAALKPGAKIQAGCAIKRIAKTSIELVDCALL